MMEKRVVNKPRGAIQTNAGGLSAPAIPSPRRVRGVHMQLTELLGREIASESLPPGHRIVPEELSERFAVSRTVVREVLKVLETKGMVEARPRAGTRILAQEKWSLLDPDVISWRSSGPDSARQFQELLDVRSAIEPLAARKAAEQGGSADKQPLIDAVNLMTAAASSRDWEAFIEADVRFHRALLFASGSLIIGKFADPIEAALRVRHALNLLPDRPSAATVAAHKMILDAITAEDPALAEHESRRIVDAAGGEIFESLKEQST